MKSTTDILSIFIGAGIVQGFFFSIFLVSNKKGNRRANTMLAILLLVFSFSMIHSLMNINNPDSFKFFPINVREPFLLLLGPLLLLYVSELTGNFIRFRIRNFFHALPFILYFCIIFPFYFHAGLATYADLFNIIIWGIILIENAIYFYKIRNLVKGFEQKIKNNFSAIEKISLKWLLFFMYLFLAIIGLFLLLFILLIHADPIPYFDKALALILSLAIYSLGYKGLFQIEIFNSQGNAKIDHAEIRAVAQNISNKYQRSGLTENDARSLSAKLLEIMDTKKPFFDPELSLPALARIAEMPRNSLSQIINDQFGSNFYDFINKYRVEEMKKLLADPQKQARTILSLAFDAGFNSKPAFNTIFKRFTGLTPTQYKKSFS